jgi:hypothetical protein
MMQGRGGYAVLKKIFLFFLEIKVKTELKKKEYFFQKPCILLHSPLKDSYQF